VVIPPSGSHGVRLNSGRTFTYRLRIVHDSPNKEPFGEKVVEEILSQTDRFFYERFGENADVPDDAMADAEDELEKNINAFLAQSEDASVREVTAVGVTIKYVRKPNAPVHLYLGRPSSSIYERGLDK